MACAFNYSMSREQCLSVCGAPLLFFPARGDGDVVGPKKKEQKKKRKKKWCDDDVRREISRTSSLCDFFTPSFEVYFPPLPPISAFQDSSTSPDDPSPEPRDGYLSPSSIYSFLPPLALPHGVIIIITSRHALCPPPTQPDPGVLCVRSRERDRERRRSNGCAVRRFAGGDHTGFRGGFPPATTEQMRQGGGLEGRRRSSQARGWQGCDYGGV